MHIRHDPKLHPSFICIECESEKRSHVLHPSVCDLVHHSAAVGPVGNQSSYAHIYVTHCAGAQMIIN